MVSSPRSKAESLWGFYTQKAWSEHHSELWPWIWWGNRSERGRKCTGSLHPEYLLLWTSADYVYIPSPKTVKPAVIAASMVLLWNPWKYKNLGLQKEGQFFPCQPQLVQSQRLQWAIWVLLIFPSSNLTLTWQPISIFLSGGICKHNTLQYKFVFIPVYVT